MPNTFLSGQKKLFDMKNISSGNNGNFYSYSTTSQTTVINGKKVTKTVETINNNGKKEKKYVDIDEFGNKKEWKENNDDSLKKKLKEK
jgi:hypothetical protein